MFWSWCHLLSAGAAAFSADIMPTAVLTPGAKLASPDAVAADVSIATMVAPSKLVTATAEAEVTDVTVPSLESANLTTAEVAATADFPVPMRMRHRFLGACHS